MWTAHKYSPRRARALFNSVRISFDADLETVISLRFDSRLYELTDVAQYCECLFGSRWALFDHPCMVIDMNLSRLTTMTPVPFPLPAKRTGYSAVHVLRVVARVRRAERERGRGSPDLAKWGHCINSVGWALSRLGPVPDTAPTTDRPKLSTLHTVLIRKNFGHSHISQHFAAATNQWRLRFLNPDMNFHRPFFVEDTAQDWVCVRWMREDRADRGWLCRFQDGACQAMDHGTKG